MAFGNATAQITLGTTIVTIYPRYPTVMAPGALSRRGVRWSVRARHRDLADTLTKLITDDNARALYDLPRATQP